eukprot:TRINITY_DN4681_c0_g1_i2.p1 TRINITY_DN4681_c0_g1~~TRINITY_DN4681_c0_g1_i2.p1  ORF type:complete len:320 (+),score=77.84 TRINITY_DN4681_c0_g1_i2:326-1285(+)
MGYSTKGYEQVNGVCLGYFKGLRILCLASQTRELMFFEIVDTAEQFSAVPYLTLNFPTAMNQVGISPDGTTVVSVGDRPEIYFFSTLENKKQCSEILTTQQADGKYITKVMTIGTPPKSRGYSGGTHICWSPNSQYCGVAMDCGNMLVYNKEGILVHCFALPEGSGRLMEFSPKFPQVPALLCSSVNSDIFIINTDLWTKVSRIQLKGDMGGITFDSNGIHFYVGTRRGTSKFSCDVYPPWKPSLTHLYPETFQNTLFLLLWANKHWSIQLPKDVLFLVISFVSLSTPPYQEQTISLPTNTNAEESEESEKSENELPLQ